MNLQTKILNLERPLNKLARRVWNTTDFAPQSVAIVLVSFILRHMCGNLLYMEIVEFVALLE